jgi:hypothetical protein
VSNRPWNQLLTKTEPYTFTPQGLIYTSLSSLDKSTWLNPRKHILMNTCSDVSTISNGAGVLSPRFMPSDDAYGTLYMTNFTSGKWVEYQLEAGKDLKALNLCYLAYSKTKVQISIDGAAVAEIELPRSADEAWHIATESVSLKAGKHTLRITNISGNTNIHWMIFN